MAKATDADMVSLSRMASSTPAKVMGFFDRGRIAEGLRADLIIMNNELEIQKTILNGEII
jgi:N-acetylglucosamine-6-phosphate deacetylase